MNGMNCWEFKECGRGPEGSQIAELGVCPAAEDTTANGMNRGINGGRMCWAISGTLCGGIVQGTHADKLLSCMACDFFDQVKNQEKNYFMMLKPGQKYRRSEKMAKV